jgi:GNAT superfamily N-acetyltransferase
MQAYNPVQINTFYNEIHPEAQIFAQRRGFEESLREVDMRLDLTRFNEAELPELMATHLDKLARNGVEIYSVAELLHHYSEGDLARQVYELDMSVSADVPSTSPFEGIEYELWERDIWKRETFSCEGTMLAVCDDQLVGLTIIVFDRAGYLLQHGLTGVHKDYRRRGIALGLKLKAIRYAQQTPYRILQTLNEEHNLGILKINQLLGFKPQPAWISVKKILHPVE